VGAGDAEIIEQARDRGRQRSRARFGPRGQRPGVPEARQVDGKDVEVPGEGEDDGIPGLA
jgi:hypothetical protein